MAANSLYQPDAPLGLIAGSGDLPKRIIAAHKNVFVLAIEDHTPVDIVEHVPHSWCRIGAVGKALEILHERDITQLVMAGNISRPSLKNLMPDAMGASLLKRLGAGLFAGDDRLLTIITRFLEEQGLTIIGAHDICQSMLAEAGILTRHKPDKAARTDITKAIDVLQSLSNHDVGQAVIVCGGHVLGIEALEGTAALIERAAALKFSSGGVLVKLPKVGQELRVDMPTVGIETIESLIKGGFAGLVIGANATLMLNKREMVALANQHSIFIEVRAL